MFGVFVIGFVQFDDIVVISDNNGSEYPYIGSSKWCSGYLFLLL